MLRTLQDDINSDKSYFDRLDENRKETLARILESTFATLRRLQKLTIKYRELGIDDGIQFWRKLKWSTKQREITDLKNRVMAHSCNINLCMTSIGKYISPSFRNRLVVSLMLLLSSSLARIEASMVRALERQEASTLQDPRQSLEDEDESSGLTPLHKAKSTPSEPTMTPDVNGLGFQGLQRQLTGATLVDNHNIHNVSSESTPTLSEGDPQEFLLPRTAKVEAPAMSRIRKDSNHNMQKASFSRPTGLPTPPRSSNDLFDGTTKPPLEVQGTLRKRVMSNPVETYFSQDEHGLGSNDPNLQEVVAEAMQELVRIRQKEQSARPLRVVAQDLVHQPDNILKARFQQFAEDELKIRRLNAKDWLRVATWWLLKARFNTRLEENSQHFDSRASFSVSSSGKSAINQAYVDLLKASWLLHSIILRDDHKASLLNAENRKLFHNLSDGINDDLGDFQPVDAPDRGTLLQQNSDIWERLQPEEESYNDDALLGLENGRWITVEQDDAGDETEQVLFRTFVNAAVGRKTHRMRSKGAPYLLLLSIKEGESEPKVTFCNQSGTLCLTKDFTVDDLREKDTLLNPVTGPNIGGPREAITLNFGRMNVSVAFTNEQDLGHFMYIPKAYFDAVARREPRQLSNATETLLFSRSVEVFEQLKPSTLKPLSPRQQYPSCDLRILETTCKEGWRTTRRLVISSSAGEKTPWCTEFFLPLSRVQIRRDGIDRLLAVKWSDCAHEKANKTDGNYNKIYSYVYDESNPNIALSLLFRNSQDATDFEKTALQLSIPPIFECTTGPDSRIVYMISDAEPNPKNYKAILLTHTRFEWKYSEVFYMYRDTDFQYDRSALRVRFSQVYYADYISTHVEKLYRTPLDEPPHFSHCDKRLSHTTIEFEAEAVATQFLSSLTSKYTLLFSRRAHSITTKTPSRWGGSTKSSKGPPEVQLWLKGNTMRLISRWDGKVEDKWLSMAVPRSGLDHKRDSNRVSLPKVQYDRGRKIDMANLVARDPRDKKEEGIRKVGPVIIAFESVRGESSLELILRFI